MTPTNKSVEVVVFDASVAVAISARESDKEQAALRAIEFYKDQQCLFFAPGAIFSESLYVRKEFLRWGHSAVPIQSEASHRPYSLDPLQERSRSKLCVRRTPVFEPGTFLYSDKTLSNKIWTVTNNASTAFRRIVLRTQNL